MALAIGCYFSTDLYAQVPRQISYQGVIMDPSGHPIADGDHKISVMIYNQPVGGTPVYAESQSLPVSHGLFTIIIGAVTPIPSSVKFEGTMYLGIHIDEAEEVLPRTALVSAPFAIRAETADFARALAPDAKGLITSINELSGPITISGDSTLSVTQKGNSLVLHSFATTSVGGSSGISRITAGDPSIAVTGSNGPSTTITVSDNGIITSKIADGAITPLKLNQAGATNGQVLKWNGTKWSPADDNASALTAGTGVVIQNNAISVARPLPVGTLLNSTLHWDGASWSENVNMTSSAAGLTAINNHLSLTNSGAASELRLFEPSGGPNYSAFKAQNQSANITYTLPATLPATTGYLVVDNTGTMSWSPTSSGQPTFAQILAGTNQNQTLSVGAGSTLVPTGTGIIIANQFIGSGSTSNSVDLGTNEVAGILPIANGGTNSSTALGNNRIMYSSGGSIVEFAAGAAGQVLTSAGVGSAPQWTTVASLPTGTGIDNTLRWNGTAWVESSNVKSSLAGLVTTNAGVNFAGIVSPLQVNGSAGTSGQVLTSAGAGATPTWATVATLPTGTATDNTLRWSGTSWVESANIKSSTAGLLTTNAGVNLAGTSSPLQVSGSTGTNGQVLTSAGAGTTPTWTTITTLPTGTATDNTLRWNGTAWVENANVKESAAGLITANAGLNLTGTTSPLQVGSSAGTSGQVLTSAGAGTTPTWTTITTLPTGTATDNTLRWNGIAWVENANVKESALGLLTVNAGANLTGTTSPLQLGGSAGTSGQVLTSAGAGATPTWTTVATLPTGTATDNTLRWNGTAWVETSNVKSSAAGLLTTNAGVNLAGTSSPLQVGASAGTTGQVLTSAGAGATPTWTSIATLPTGTATDNTLRWNGTSWIETSNVKSSAAGLLTTNAGVNLAGTSSPLQVGGSAGTSGQVLTSAGIGATPTWASVATLPTGTATDNTLRWNGTAWVENANVKESAVGLVTTNAGINLAGTSSPVQVGGSAGTSGQVLTSAGAGSTPTWTSVATLPTGTATDNTLRWNGTTWVESANIKSSAAGLLTTNAGVNLAGTGSPLQVGGSAGTSGQVLTSAGAGSTPTWATVPTLPTGSATDNTLRWNGTTWVENSNIKSSAAGLLTTNAGVNLAGTSSPLQVGGSAGTSGQVLMSAGAGSTPTWTSIATFPTGTTANSTLRWTGTTWAENANILSSAAGQLTVKNGLDLNGTVNPITLNGSNGTNGQVLTSAGAGSTPTWTTINTLPDGTITNSTLRWNGASWSENANILSSPGGQLTVNAGVNLSGSSSTLQVNGSAGTNGQVLMSVGGSSTPVWSTLTAGNNISITPGSGTLTIAVSNGLPTGTATDNTLRWNGTNWVESSSVKSSASGQLSAGGGINLSGGTSPLLANSSAGITGQVLVSNGVGTTPSWTTLSLPPSGTGLDNTLRWNGSQWVESGNVKSSAGGRLTVNGGMNFNGAASDIQVNGSSGNSGQVLTSGGAGNTPSWTTITSIAAGTAADNTMRWSGTAWVETSGVKSTSTGQLAVTGGINHNGTGSPLLLNSSPGTFGQVLTSSGAGATPNWTSITTVGAGTSTDNTLRWNGTNWVETSNVQSSTGGKITVNAGLNLNSTASPLYVNGLTGTVGQVLTSAGSGNTPSWTTLTIPANGTGADNTLRWSGTAWVESSNVKSSATGQLSVTGGVVLSGTTSQFSTNGNPGTAGQVLTSNGAGSTPTWSTVPTLPGGSTVNSTLRWNGTNWIENTNVLESAAGFITSNGGMNISGANSPVQMNGNAGTSGQVLTSAGAGSTPSWSTLPSFPNGTATNSTLRWNGTGWVENTSVTASGTGQINAASEVLTSGLNLSGTTSPLQLNGSTGTAGQVLTSGGIGSTPSWTTVAVVGAGSTTDNMLRWSGTSWVETGAVQTTAAGIFKVNTGETFVGTSTPLNVRGSDGTNGYVFASQGAGATPQWVDPSTLITAWKLTGNSITGTDGVNNLFGTTAGSTLAPVNIVTNGNRAMRFEPSATSPNVIGGYNGNSASSGAIGAAIGGGGAAAAVNTVSDNYGVVAGGASNTAGNSGVGATYASVSGGLSNTSTAQYASIAGGHSNSAIAVAAHIGGGESNAARGTYSTVGGGSTNIAAVGSTYSVIPGGRNLTVGANTFGVNMGTAADVSGMSAIGYFGNMNLMVGNTDNTARELQFYSPNSSGTYAGAHYTSFVAGAQANNITYTLPTAQPSANQVLAAATITGSGPYNVTLGWQTPGAASGWVLTGNSVTGTDGVNNLIGTVAGSTLTPVNVVVNGVRAARFETSATSPNVIEGYSTNSVTSGAIGAAIGGGGFASNANTVNDNYGTIGGGAKNIAGNGGSGAIYPTIGGGYNNTSAGIYSTVGGGSLNAASGSSATVAGGYGNAANAAGGYCFVGGGLNNLSSATGAAVGGGTLDTASGQYSFVGGGQHNVAGGQYSAITGGINNSINLTANYGTISGGSGNSIVGSTNYSVIPGGQNLTLGSTSFGVNMGTAADISSLSGIAYFGNMNLIVNNTDGTARKIGVNTNSPTTSVDINGDIAIRPNTIGALANGNVAIASGNNSYLRVTANGGGTSITGISGGQDGKIIVIYNTANNLTIVDQNAGAGANKIHTMSGANITTTGEGMITLIYDGTASAWMVTSFMP